MKTYQPKQKEINKQQHRLDAKGRVLGRLATEVATLLMGKQKASYSAHLDSGDDVVVVNAAKVVVTGRKDEQKVYRSHSGYPGGFKEVTYKKLLKEHPERIIIHAVAGMLPKNRLRDKRLAKLKVFAAEEK